MINPTKVEPYPGEQRVGGTSSWRTFNQGNLRIGAFARRHGGVPSESNPGFAKFASEEEGMNALIALLQHNYMHLSVKDAIEKYAPKKDRNDTERYRGCLARQGIDIAGQVGSQIDKFPAAIRECEGWKPGVRRDPKGNGLP